VTKKTICDARLRKEDGMNYIYFSHWKKGSINLLYNWVIFKKMKTVWHRGWNFKLDKLT
jgi:hypothetical protein